jgi:2-iminobutanoate/2-iminopropanoate deaminase
MSFQEETHMTDLEAVASPANFRTGSPYSSALRAGAFMFVSGHVPIAPADGSTVGDDTATQTRQVLENVKRTIEAGGSRMNRVVKTTVFLTHIEDFQDMNRVYREYFTEPLPARSTVEVSALARPDYRVEIEAVVLAAD